MLKTMREGSAFFIKGVMLFVVVTIVGTIYVVWGVKSTPGDLGRRGVIAVVGNAEIMAVDYQQAFRRQVEMYKQVFGDKLDEKLLESLNLNPGEGAHAPSLNGARLLVAAAARARPVALPGAEFCADAFG